jgi:hypothetical protein
MRRKPGNRDENVARNVSAGTATFFLFPSKNESTAFCAATHGDSFPRATGVDELFSELCDVGVG